MLHLKSGDFSYHRAPRISPWPWDVVRGPPMLLMETSLHRQLKAIYADGAAQQEARLERFRIDVVCGDELVEIQHGKLAAIRDKIAHLLESHRVLVVKPIVAQKHLVRLDAPNGRVVSRRLSPKRGTVLDVFHELVYFTRVFPHPNLTLEVPLVEIEETRFPGHGRRRWRHHNDHVVADQQLLRIDRIHRFRTGRDLAELIPARLPAPFHTGHLAETLGVQRWIAQRIAYCLRRMKIAAEVGKTGNTRLYEFAAEIRRRDAG